MRAHLTLSLAAVALLSACSLILDTDRHRGDYAPVAATEFCAELADIACTGLRDCCPQPDVDFDACTRRVSSDCAADFGALGIDPRTGYDPRLAGLALAEARGLVADCDPAIQSWTSDPLGFQRVLAGSIAIGDTCDPNFLDVPNLFACEQDGICTQMGTAAEPDWACALPKAEGDECTYDGVCEPGLRCTSAIQFVTTGTCAPLKPNGEACGRNSECETFLCDVTCRTATNDEAYCGAED